MTIIEGTPHQQQVFGQRLRQLRHHQGLSLRAVAKILGINHATLGHWERGTMSPGAITLRRLAGFYSVDLYWLRMGIGDPKPGPTTSEWPSESLRTQWGIDVESLPLDWSPAFTHYCACAVNFGLNPTVGSLAEMVEVAKNLLPNERSSFPLPLELTLSLQAASAEQSPLSRRRRELAEWILESSDAELDIILKMIGKGYP